MKRYKLLKDLPNLKKGTILSEGEPIFGVKTLITKNNDACTTFIDNELFENFFEEIQEEPTDSIHWKPKEGDNYFYIVHSYNPLHNEVLVSAWIDDDHDRMHYLFGNIYRSYEEAEKARDRRLAEVRLRRTSTFKPDFENDNGGWVVFYNPREKKLEIQEVYRFDYGEIVRYETKEDAKKSIKENREDWLTYFGIEEEK